MLHGLTMWPAVCSDIAMKSSAVSFTALSAFAGSGVACYGGSELTGLACVVTSAPTRPDTSALLHAYLPSYACTLHCSFRPLHQRNVSTSSAASAPLSFNIQQQEMDRQADAEAKQHMDAELESVNTAIVANSLIFVAKVVVFVLSGSRWGSMQQSYSSRAACSSHAAYQIGVRALARMLQSRAALVLGMPDASASILEQPAPCTLRHAATSSLLNNVT